jgi:hypothetical protein
VEHLQTNEKAPPSMSEQASAHESIDDRVRSNDMIIKDQFHALFIRTGLQGQT